MLTTFEKGMVLGWALAWGLLFALVPVVVCWIRQDARKERAELARQRKATP